MCYEERLFRRWGTKKAEKLEEIRRAVERTPAPVVPIHAKPASETRKPKEVETELETA